MLYKVLYKGKKAIEEKKFRGAKGKVLAAIPGLEPGATLSTITKAVRLKPEAKDPEASAKNQVAYHLSMLKKEGYISAA